MQRSGDTATVAHTCSPHLLYRPEGRDPYATRRMQRRHAAAAVRPPLFTTVLLISRAAPKRQRPELPLSLQGSALELRSYK